jgi:hypothetical protein
VHAGPVDGGHDPDHAAAIKFADHDEHHLEGVAFCRSGASAPWRA